MYHPLHAPRTTRAPHGTMTPTAANASTASAAANAARVAELEKENDVLSRQLRSLENAQDGDVRPPAQGIYLPTHLMPVPPALTRAATTLPRHHVAS